MNSLTVYALALGANLTFSTSSMVFSIFATRFSSFWMNQLKVAVAFVAFVIAMFVTDQFVPIKMEAVGFLFLSGFFGLCLGDILLFRAYTTLGAGRSLVLFSMQPLMLGLYGYFFLAQVFSSHQVLAVICMIACVFIFMLERNKMTGSWDLQSFIWALSGITLDAGGVMLTRHSYEISPGLETFQVNVIRCMGALVGYFILKPKNHLVILNDLKTLTRKEKTLLFSSIIFGCFVSLTLYLAAVKHAHVGTLTALSITGPIWVSLLECLYYRRLPNRYLVAAFSVFLVGFYFMALSA